MKTWSSKSNNRTTYVFFAFAEVWRPARITNTWATRRGKSSRWVAGRFWRTCENCDQPVQLVLRSSWIFTVPLRSIRPGGSHWLHRHVTYVRCWILRACQHPVEYPALPGTGFNPG